VNFTAPVWDRELRALRHDAAWMACARSIPALAPWVAPECAVPIGSVEAMGELRNTWRRFVVGGHPVVVGLHVVGDALCHTNPSYGKGTSLALAHAVALANVLDAAPDDPLAQAQALDGTVAVEARQWYEFAVATDRWRRRTWRGAATVPPTPEDDVYGFIQSAVPTAATADPVVFRAHRRQFHVLDLPAALVGNAEVLERARRVAAVHQRAEAPPPAPVGPDRATLLALLASIEPCARSTHRPTITDP
jgi:hypothetical protein